MEYYDYHSPMPEWNEVIRDGMIKDCKHCGNPIEANNVVWYHTKTGSIWCHKDTIAEPKEEQ